MKHLNANEAVSDQIRNHKPPTNAQTSKRETLQSWLIIRLAKQLSIEPTEIDIHASFSSYGLSSATAVELSGELETWLQRELSPTLLFDYPNIAVLAHYLLQDRKNVDSATSYKRHISDATPEEPIAIIGIGCRFPGDANTPERFWDILQNGVDTVTEVPATRWNSDAYYNPDPDIPGKMYTRSGSFLSDLDQFDAQFFGISPREAVRMHPQQRLLLEVAWEALENAGQKLESLAGSQTAVFVGVMATHDYALLQAQSGDETYIDDPYFGIGNASSITSGRISYLFDLQGPNLAIDTACSSSLVAIHLACESLRHNECSMALVGGVSTNLHPEQMINACKMHMLSPQGRCKTFDATADGFAIGEGCGVVILKRLSDALSAQDPVLAIIRGSAVNQDGHSNGITAPSKLAQEAVIRQALAQAQIDPLAISYVEAHGSATSLGDPIEIEALAATFGQARSLAHPLMVGSVKTNIGHLGSAAGIAGLIKTVLALQHREIPPHLHLKERNPHIRWDACPVVIPTSRISWDADDGQPRIAGVSSFGWSGTNAHIILEEGPRIIVAEPEENKSHVILLSAKTEAALELATEALLLYLKQHPEVSLADVAYTYHVGRTAFAHRRTLVCENSRDAISALESRDPTKIMTSYHKAGSPSVTVLFPDGGDDYTGTAQQLYAQEKRHLLPVPNYPFMRQRYWIDTQVMERAPLKINTVELSKHDRAQWLYVPIWKQAQPPLTTLAHATTQCILLFLDEYGFGRQLGERLRAHGHTVLSVIASQSFQRIAEEVYTIRPEAEEDYDALLKQLNTLGKTPDQIIHLWSLTPGELDTCNQEQITNLYNRVFYSLLHLAHSIGNHQYHAPLHLTVISNQLHNVLGEEEICPEKALLLGPCKVMPKEYPALSCCSIDITLNEPDSSQEQALLAKLATDIFLSPDKDVIAYRGTQRWEQDFEHVQLPDPASGKTLLREGGVYLITGGLGGIALAIAEYLARTVQARLVLIGRSKLPPREQWPNIIATHGTTEKTLLALQRIEDLGGQVLPLQADVTNEDQMQEVIKQTLSTFGTLHGVLHAAGIPGMGLLQLKTPEQAAHVLAPKVQGTRVLERVLANLPLDFLALFSSISSSIGGPGQADYSAANAFLDAYAHRYYHQHGKTIAIDWSEWQWNAWEAGLAGYDNETQKLLKEHRQRIGITFAEGTQAFAQALTYGLPQIIVSPQDLNQLTRLMKSFTITSLQQTASNKLHDLHKHPRPTLGSSYTPPRNQLEQAIVSIWEELLSITPVGIHDNFFELGGNSLLGIDLTSRIRKTLQLETFPAHVLYEVSSISTMAQYIEQGHKGSVMTSRMERGEKRRAELKQRMHDMRQKR